MNKEEMNLFFEFINGIEIVGGLEPMGRELIKKGVETLKDENKQLKDTIDKAKKYIKMMGKYDGESCTRNFKMMSADFNEILSILDEVKDDL